VPLGETTLRIDMAARLDHMRQHLGEHILSAVIERDFGGKIAILRIEPESSHIEIDRPLTPGQLWQAQVEVNKIIAENRPVSVHYFTPSEAEVRGIPAAKAEAHARVRVVEIPGLDFNGCGGTHCRATGEVEKLLICGTKEVRGKFRIYFKCGGRCDTEEQLRTDHLLTLQTAFGAELLPEFAEKAVAVLARKEQLELQNKALRESLVAADAALWLAEATDAGGQRMIFRLIENGDAKHVKAVCDAVITAASAVIIAGVAENGQISLIFARARSKNPEPNLGARLRNLAAAHGGKGGGSAIAAQGMMADTPASRAALRAVFEELIGA
jgi:alanyl-tRNA synthetase